MEFDPRTGATIGDSSDLRSFLIADVRGYTRFTNERGDEAASQLAGRFAALTRDALAAYGGTLLELRGDAVSGSTSSLMRSSYATAERRVSLMSVDAV
jgi:class 3 adenylate cyclase